MRQAVCDLLAKMPEPHTGRLWPDESIRTAFEDVVDAARVGSSPFTISGATPTLPCNEIDKTAGRSPPRSAGRQHRISTTC
jgi:hypothetical protein